MAAYSISTEIDTSTPTQQHFEIPLEFANNFYRDYKRDYKHKNDYYERHNDYGWFDTSRELSNIDLHKPVDFFKTPFDPYILKSSTNLESRFRENRLDIFDRISKYFLNFSILFMSDSDFDIPQPKPKNKRSISFKIEFLGRGKPLPFDDD